jgi:hypothetical protein
VNPLALLVEHVVEFAVCARATSSMPSLREGSGRHNTAEGGESVFIICVLVLV